MTTSPSRNAWPSSNITCSTSGIMKTRKRDSARVALPPPTHRWLWYATGLAALVVLFWVYGPDMHTGFLFDDARQQSTLEHPQPLSAEPRTRKRPPVRPPTSLARRSMVVD